MRRLKSLPSLKICFVFKKHLFLSRSCFCKNFSFFSRQIMQTGLKPPKENDPETGLLDSADKFKNGMQKQQKKEIRSQLVKLSIMISMTFIVFLVELFYGYFSHSVALVADAFHMLSDVLALSVALACILVCFLNLLQK